MACSCLESHYTEINCSRVGVIQQGNEARQEVHRLCRS
eukprot:XP_001708366.1 Hypothetical protein GL50803_36583 [Giardia lamblia ATCC 50803]